MKKPTDTDSTLGMEIVYTDNGSTGTIEAIRDDGLPHLCEANGGEHVSVCAAHPLHVPLPIPRSATFQVALGACTCAEDGIHDGPLDTGSDYYKPEILRHADTCPARPVKVSCSISGKTWEESEVDACEYRTRNGVLFKDLDPSSQLWLVVRARWALVKALVLGQAMETVEPDARWVGAHELFTQRDAVYAALADMARAEAITEAAQVAFFEALHDAPGTIVRVVRPSHSLLETYVDHLIEQVGILGVAP